MWWWRKPWQHKHWLGLVLILVGINLAVITLPFVFWVGLAGVLLCLYGLHHFRS